MGKTRMDSNATFKILKVRFKNKDSSQAKIIIIIAEIGITVKKFEEIGNFLNI